MSDKRFFITTAIDYTNGAPHFGHAYEKVLADAIARTQRLMGHDTYFLTGTDEHGQKVQQSAAKLGKSEQAYVDELSVSFREILPLLNVKNDYFIRTTDAKHKQVVQDILQKVYDAGLIYQKETKGSYSVREEQFLMDKDRRPDGTWGPEWGEVVELAESNYYFRQSQYQGWLIDYLNTHPDFIYPRYRMAQVLEFLKEPLNDLCISRPKSRLKWGIELPFDKEYVTYVWFDALINYISAVGYGTPQLQTYWPADLHVIGKDILVPPHAVYWPIMLHALGLTPPKRILAHGWWTSDGQKMSKSIGNGVDPVEVCKKYGSDAFRYFVLREMQVGYDADYTQELFDRRYNSDLANDLGNLVSRLGNMLGRYGGGTVGTQTIAEEPEKNLHAAWQKAHANATAAYSALEYHKGLEATWEFIKLLNAYLELRQPWKLAKSEDATDKARVETSLATVAEGLRLASALASAVIPTTAAKVRASWGLSELTTWGSELAWGHSLQGKRMEPVGILFPKHDEKKVEVEKK